jgi:hypothetical protein
MKKKKYKNTKGKNKKKKKRARDDRFITETTTTKEEEKGKVASLAPTLIVDDVVVDGFVKSRLGVADSTRLSVHARVE